MNALRVSSFRQPSRHSFTLIEMLVSIAILSLLITLLCVMMNSTSATVGTSLARIESNQEGRAILDRIQIDLHSMLVRPDIDYAFLKQTGNDTLAFYATEPGYSASASTKRVVSVVNYQVAVPANNSSSPPVLQRGANDSFQWNGSSAGGMLFQANPTLQSSTSPINSLVATTGDVLSQDVFRFEVSFLTNGALTPVQTLSATTTIANLNAIIVTIASLDSQNRKIVGSSPTTWNQIIAALPDPTGTSASTAALWNTNIASASFPATAGIPAKAAAAVRVYERYFYLNHQP